MDQKDRLQIIITAGDRNTNGRVDLSVSVEAAVPVLGTHKLTFGPFDVPVDQALAAAQTAAGAIPPPAGQVVATILGLVKLFLA